MCELTQTGYLKVLRNYYNHRDIKVTDYIITIGRMNVHISPRLRFQRYIRDLVKEPKINVKILVSFFVL